MYICVCNAVTDSDIHEAVESGVRNMRQLVKQTGCSSTCAKCVDAAIEVLDEALDSRRGCLRIVPSAQVA